MGAGEALWCLNHIYKVFRSYLNKSVQGYLPLAHTRTSLFPGSKWCDEAFKGDTGGRRGFCEISEKDSASHQDHILNHHVAFKPVECNLCGIVYNDSRLLQQHIVHIHSNGEKLVHDLFALVSDSVNKMSTNQCEELDLWPLFEIDCPICWTLLKCSYPLIITL